MEKLKGSETLEDGKEGKTDEETNALYVEYQLLVKQIEELDGQLNLVNQREMQTKEAIEAVKEIYEKKPSEVLVDIAGGIFMNAIVKDNSNFFVNVGAGVSLNKNASEILGLLDKKLASLNEGKSELKHALNMYATRIEEIRTMLTKNNKVDFMADKKE